VASDEGMGEQEDVVEWEELAEWVGVEGGQAGAEMEGEGEPEVIGLVHLRYPREQRIPEPPGTIVQNTLPGLLLLRIRALYFFFSFYLLIDIIFEDNAQFACEFNFITIREGGTPASFDTGTI
jgi:hypothetical protein